MVFDSARLDLQPYAGFDMDRYVRRTYCSWEDAGIEKAKRLLRDTDLPIAQIASRCGFSSPGALSTAFVRHAGTRPSAYRNR